MHPTIFLTPNPWLCALDARQCLCVQPIGGAGGAPARLDERPTLLYGACLRRDGRIVLIQYTVAKSFVLHTQQGSGAWRQQALRAGEAGERVTSLHMLCEADTPQLFYTLSTVGGHKLVYQRMESESETLLELHDAESLVLEEARRIQERIVITYTLRQGGVYRTHKADFLQSERLGLSKPIAESASPPLGFHSIAPAGSEHCAWIQDGQGYVDGVALLQGAQSLALSYNSQYRLDVYGTGARQAYVSVDCAHWQPVDCPPFRAEPLRYAVVEPGSLPATSAWLSPPPPELELPQKAVPSLANIPIPPPAPRASPPIDPPKPSDSRSGRKGMAVNFPPIYPGQAREPEPQAAPAMQTLSMPGAAPDSPPIPQAQSTQDMEGRMQRLEEQAYQATRKFFSLEAHVKQLQAAQERERQLREQIESLKLALSALEAQLHSLGRDQKR